MKIGLVDFGAFNSTSEMKRVSAPRPENRVSDVVLILGYVDALSISSRLERTDNTDFGKGVNEVRCGHTDIGIGKGLALINGSDETMIANRKLIHY